MMLRQKVQQAEQQANENKASSEVLMQMIQTGAAKIGEGDSIIVNPSQQELQFSVTANQMEDDKQIHDQQPLNAEGSSLDNKL